MPGDSDTLHSRITDYWRRKPIPLAEIGIQMSTHDPGFSRQLVALTEMTYCLGVAIGMAATREDEKWPTLANKLWRMLQRSALGGRAHAVELLDELVPDACGWKLDEPCLEVERLRQELEMDQAPATMRTALNTVVRARNAYLHPSGRSRDQGELLARWNDALLVVIEGNRAFTRRSMLWIAELRQKVRQPPRAIATALRGRVPMPWRRGEPQLVHHTLEPGHVVLWGRDDGVLDLHPFVVYEDGYVFVLSELGKWPVYWRYARTRSVVEGPVDELLQLFPNRESVSDDFADRDEAGDTIDSHDDGDTLDRDEASETLVK